MLPNKKMIGKSNIILFALPIMAYINFMIIMIMIINLTIGHSRSSLPVQTYVQQQL